MLEPSKVTVVRKSEKVTHVFSAISKAEIRSPSAFSGSC